MKKLEEKIGVSLWILIVLALLGVPRVILHDFSIIEEGTFLNALLVFIPTVIWMIYIIRKNVTNPFLTMWVLCMIYGVFLMVIHQILWSYVFPNGIVLGGNLTELNSISEIIGRGFGVISSITTGAVMGFILGTLTYFINKFIKKWRETNYEI